MALVAQDLSLTVDGVPHLAGIGVTLARGGLYTVLGRTLAGKTTLLRVIAGLQAVDDGTLALDGRDYRRLPVWRRSVAMVYQQFINYPHLDALANVAFPLRRAGVDPAEADRRARETLARVGLQGFENRRPSQLSGGQQQRVALARALVKNADLLLLDEPLVNLDYKLREQLREEFRGILSEQAHSIVLYTTTDPAEAMLLGRTITVMHEGRILQVGDPATVFDRPADVRVAGIINDPPMNLIDGVIADGAIRLAGDTRLALPRHMAGLAPGAYRFGLRATDVTPAADGVAMQVELAEISGSETLLHVVGSCGRLVLQMEGVHGYVISDRVGVLLPSDRMFVFGGEGGLLRAPGDAGRGV
ncbi:MAG: ABC transporter ATP-binding protein [Pseudomonadota bacterium]